MSDFIQQQAKTWCDMYKWHKLNPEYPFDDSPNGPGSRLDTTLAVRTWLPRLIDKYGVKTMLDAPCGEWTWFCTLHRFLVEHGISYQGWDVVPDVIRLNQMAWPRHRFSVVNMLTVQKFPQVDLVLCRDFMIHLPNDEIVDLLLKIRASGSPYLLATNNPTADNDHVAGEGDAGWTAYYDRRVNLEIEPFNLLKVDAIPETTAWSDNRDWLDKELGLFEL